MIYYKILSNEEMIFLNSLCAELERNNFLISRIGLVKALNYICQKYDVYSILSIEYELNSSQNTRFLCVINSGKYDYNPSREQRFDELLAIIIKVCNTDF